MTELVQAYWPVLGAALGALIWLIRLEGVVKYQKDALKEFKEESLAKEKAVWNKVDGIAESVGQVRETLARIEGKIDHK